MVTERRCRECKIVRPNADFPPDAMRHDGLAVRCRDCMAALAAIYAGTKVCCRCGEDRPRTDFHRMARRKDGLDPRCRACSQAEKKASRDRNPVTPELRRRYVATYRNRHPDRVADYDRRRNLAERFGMTMADYDALLVAQAGVCGICGQAESALNPAGKVKPLAVDHCHRTGKVRGLLCAKCNTAVGLLDDSAAHMAAAIAYLERHAAESGV